MLADKYTDIEFVVDGDFFDPAIYEEYFNCNGEAQDDNNNFYDLRDADDDLSDVPEHIPRGKTEQLFFASVGDD